MKEILAIFSLLICGALSEGPYAPSGWRPNGPSFELPERAPVDPRNKNIEPQKQEYLPPKTPNQEYGPPEVDVSVQGLPTDEQLPIFQLSPINGQQYVGPNFNNDLKNLEQNLNEWQAQRDVLREFARQRELEAAYARAKSNTAQTFPRQYTPSTTTTTKPDDFKTTLPESTTENLNLNQGEVLDDKNKKQKVTVEVAKQNVQEYRPELYLSPLAQLQSANQFNQFQLGQLRAPIFLELSQRQQQAAYNPPQASGVFAEQQLLQLQQAQLAQIQLAQIQAAQAQLAQNQAVQPQNQFVPVQTSEMATRPAYLVPQEQSLVPQNQVQPQTQFVQIQPQQTPQMSSNPSYIVPQEQNFVPQSQVQPELTSQYQPGYTPQAQYPQQPIFLQPQANQLLPRPQDQQVSEQDQVQSQPQLIYQYQTYQPAYQQPQIQQPLNSYQQEIIQPQYIIQDPSYQQIQQNMFLKQVQGQVPLQSGLDVNKEDNGIDQTEDKDDTEDDVTTATAVATAFGTRTQPRPTYGAPSPVPRVQANPGYQYPTTTEGREIADNGATVAEATAVAKGRRPAKLRSRQGRVRPIFTLDRSGHLVLAQDQ